MQNSLLRIFFRALLPPLLILLFASWALAHLAAISGICTDIVNIRTPEVLQAQLKALSGFDGARIVVIGDSVAVGKTMERYGDVNWREHTLSAVLEQKWQQEFGAKVGVRALNLAIDGAVPADLERITAALEGIPIDLLVIDTAMRAFSEDFASPASEYSRPWLQQLYARGDGSFAIQGDGKFFSVLESTLRCAGEHIFPLYALRDFLHSRLFDQGAGPAAASLWQSIMQKKESSGDDDFLELLLKARSRYASVNFRPDNPQRLAFERMLTMLADRKQPTVVFYATENPEVIEDLIELEERAKWLSAFAEMAARYEDAGIGYVPPLQTLQAEYFLDHSHITHEGYLLVGEAVFDEYLRIKSQCSE